MLAEKGWWGWGTRTQPCKPRPSAAAGRRRDRTGPRANPRLSPAKPRKRLPVPGLPTPRVRRLEPPSLHRRRTPSPPLPFSGGRGCRRPPPAGRHGNRPGRSPPAACCSSRGAAAAAGSGSGGAVPRSAPSAFHGRRQPPPPLPPGAQKGPPVLPGRGEAAAAGLCPRRAGLSLAPARLRHRGLPGVGEEEEEEEGLRSGNN